MELCAAIDLRDYNVMSPSMHVNPTLTINPKPSSDGDHSDEYATALSISDIFILRESNLELDLRSLEIYLICKHKLKLNAKKTLLLHSV